MSERAARLPDDSQHCLRSQLQGTAREADIELYPDDNNIYRWKGYLQVRPRARPGTTLSDAGVNQGPVDTPYEGGTFQLALTIPEQYPLTAPQVKFVTKVRERHSQCKDNPTANSLLSRVSAFPARQIFHPNIHWKARHWNLHRLGHARSW